jgi:DNA-binding transcriptional ArsR family regulator
MIGHGASGNYLGCVQRRGRAAAKGDPRPAGRPGGAVNDLVRLLGIAQPQVSKHLRVLREVDLVRVRDDGRQRVYRLNAEPLRPIHAW